MNLADIKPAQKDDENTGFIVSINARKDNISLNLKIDVPNTTSIYPDAIRTTLPSMFDEKRYRSAELSVRKYHS